MKTIKYALIGILATLGTLAAKEDIYKKWERKLGNTGGRVYLPEGWDRQTRDDCDRHYKRRYERRCDPVEEARLRQHIEQTRRQQPTTYRPRNPTLKP